MRTNCVGANLSRLRVDRGFTQAALAEKVGVSRSLVGRTERGRVVPRTETLLAFGRTLGTTYRDLVSPVRPLASVRFRTGARMRNREQVLAEASRWLDDYRRLEDKMNDRPPFRFEAARRSTPAPAEAARAARQAVGLMPDTPIVNLCGLLEENGVKVLSLDKRQESFSGLGVGPADGGPAVAVNTWDRIPVENRIFTAARELGHLLLHPNEYETTAEDQSASSEREADAFASEFLMPDTAFGSSWDALVGYPVMHRVLRVKRLFGVSYREVLHRLVMTGRETPDIGAAFFRQYRDRYGPTLGRAVERQPLTESAFFRRHAEEPVPLPKFDFMPSRLPHLVRRAVVGEEISPGRGAEILGLHLEDMRELILDWYQQMSPRQRRDRERRLASYYLDFASEISGSSTG